MKTFKITLLLFALIGCCIIYSCKKNKSNSSNDSVYNGSKITVQKKWNITSKTLARPDFKNNVNNNYAQRPPNDTSFTAIEFLLDSSYVVFYSDGTANTGQYTTANDTTIILDSLGTLTIGSLTANSLNFALQLNGATSSILFFSTAALPVSSFTTAADSAFISGTWQVDSIILSSGNVTKPQQYLIFSPYGTFLSKTISSIDGTIFYEVIGWLYTDDTHQSFCYNTGNSTTIVNCNSTGTITASIIFSQQYTHWQLQEPESNGILNEFFHKK